MTQVLIWVDGKLFDEGEASVSVFDHSLIVGDGAFETLKTVDGVPFALNRHIARLKRSAAKLGLPEPDESTVEEACAAVVGQVPDGIGRLRVTYTGGPTPMGSPRPQSDPTPTLIVAVVPVTVSSPRSTKIAAVSWTRNERSAIAGVKSTSYGENVVALAKANSVGGTEAVFANTQGQLCEGTGSNVFVVVEGKLLTPPLASGCLAGITRELVVEWTDSRETDLPFDVLDTADEVFITSSVRDVQAVDTIVFVDHVRELPGAPGPVTTKAAEIFATRSTENPEP